MATTAEPAAARLDTYQVKLLVGNENMAGAPLLHLALLVEAETGRIVGRATITQAIAPPNDTIVIGNVTGVIHSMGLPPAHRVVSLQGTYPYVLPPPAIGTVLEEFSATLLIEQNNWNGEGSFSYGGHEVENVPVKPVSN